MRISDVVRIAGRFLIPGIAAALLFLAVLSVGYFLVYKKIMKGRKRLTGAGMLRAGVFVCYLAVIAGATLFTRPSGFVRVNLCPFSSYRQAWNTFSMSEWRNLIFNILMFVPLGIWLPVMGCCFRKYWCTYLTGFGLSVLIELVQLITRRGIVEFDDVLNNTLGTMIGFGLYALVFILWNRSRYRGRWNRRERNTGYPLWKAVVYQIPLILVCAGFGACGLEYHFQTYGNLSCLYSSRVNMDQVQVKRNAEFTQDTGTVGIYRTDVAGKEEAHRKVETVFAALGTQLQESRQDYYDSTALFYSEDNRYSLWVRYVGLTTELTDFDGIEVPGKSGCSEEVIRTALEKYGYEVPEKAEFEDQGDGNYSFRVSMLEQGDQLLDGELTCCYNEKEGFSSIVDHLIHGRKVDTVEIISQEDACREVEEGRFQSQVSNLKVLELNSVKLTYMLDTKGFYRPLYEFDAVRDGEKDPIFISAQK